MNGTRYAYSSLPSLLLKHRMSVAELYQRLEAKGCHFDRKSVYRLASLQPLQTLNMPLVGAVCDELNVPLARLISLDEPKPKLARISTETQDRLDELLNKNTEGKLSSKERAELKSLVDDVEQMSLANAKMLSSQARRQGVVTGSKSSRRKMQSA